MKTVKKVTTEHEIFELSEKRKKEYYELRKAINYFALEKVCSLEQQTWKDCQEYEDKLPTSYFTMKAKLDKLYKALLF